MSISFEEAKAALAQGGFTVDRLFELVRSVSGQIHGAASETTYLLYSSLMPDGETRAGYVVDEIVNAGGGVSISQSDVGKLLNSQALRAELDLAIKRELFVGDAGHLPTPEEQIAIDTRRNRLGGARALSGMKRTFAVWSKGLWHS